MFPCTSREFRAALIGISVGLFIGVFIMMAAANSVIADMRHRSYQTPVEVCDTVMQDGSKITTCIK